jgi:hypothetical protein
MPQRCLKALSALIDDVFSVLSYVIDGIVPKQMVLVVPFKLQFFVLSKILSHREQVRV